MLHYRQREAQNNHSVTTTKLQCHSDPFGSQTTSTCHSFHLSVVTSCVYQNPTVSNHFSKWKREKKKNSFCNRTLQDSPGYQQNKHARQQYQTIDMKRGAGQENSQVQHWGSISCKELAQKLGMTLVQIEVGVKKPKLVFCKEAVWIPLYSLHNKIWSVRTASVAVLTVPQCSVVCQRELLLCHAASLALKTGPKDLQRGLLECYRGQRRFPIWNKCKETFPCWEPRLSNSFGKIYGNTLLCVTDMSAHEIISQQQVKVPYFPVFDVVDKMGEKQFGNIQIVSILTYWAGWEQNIKTTAT